METKCAAFWHHTNIRNDNKIFPCCRFKTPVDKFDGNVVEILNKDSYIKLREQSLTGTPINGCQKCYYEESLGKKSLRQQFNEDYDTDTVSLKFLEVGLDNICNLTCDGCWDEFSSSWAKKTNANVIVRSSKEITELPATINKVLFLGGEPLMTTRHIKLLKLANRKELEVTYNTNGTFLLDADTISLLNECKAVKFILSIDGYGKLNEQVRSGSHWEDVLKFISQIKNLGYNLTIHTVVHLNNWHGLKDLEKFIEESALPWTLNVLTYPKNLDIIHAKDACAEFIETTNIPNKEYVLKHLRG